MAKKGKGVFLADEEGGKNRRVESLRGKGKFQNYFEKRSLRVRERAKNTQGNGVLGAWRENKRKRTTRKGFPFIFWTARGGGGT